MPSTQWAGPCVLIQGMAANRTLAARLRRLPLILPKLIKLLLVHMSLLPSTLQVIQVATDRPPKCVQVACMDIF